MSYSDIFSLPCLIMFFYPRCYPLFLFLNRYLIAWTTIFFIVV